MSQVDAILASLIQKTRSVDPAVADSFTFIANELRRISGIVDPAPSVESKVSAAKADAPNNVASFTYSFTSDNVVLSWEAPQLGQLLYEVRLGSTWETASRLFISANLSAVIDPIAVGTSTYLIKALNSDGIYSVDALSLSVVVPAISTPVVSSQVLGNFVLLTWTEPTTTFRIDYYVITKNGTEVARIKGTFYAIQETAGGTNTYGITAYDIAANASPEGLNTIIVAAPADFILKATFLSGFSGTKTRAVVDGSSLLVCINTTETYQSHFTSRGWAGPSAQVSAGYPRWLSPSETTASYKETFDIGTIYTNTIVNLSYLYTLINGTFTVGFSTRVSNDGISWSVANTNQSFFVASARYIEVTINFSGSSDLALMYFYNFQVAISVKQEMDSGEVSAVSTDALGTVVTFNKAFKDVDSITLDTETGTREQFDVVYTFSDVPDPTGFNVFVYDTSGIRVSKTVRWKARGII